jgi:hypothetical protein
MSTSISITESKLYTALRSFLLGVVACPVIQTQQNRSAMPTGDFCAMTSLGTYGLSTDKASYIPLTGTESHTRSTRWDVQLDLYGTDAAENANMIATLLRTDYACTQLAASGIDMQPLYAADPRQGTIINGEQQYEKRWIVEASFQFNPVVSVPQDFANSLTVTPAEIDAVFPPT